MKVVIVFNSRSGNALPKADIRQLFKKAKIDIEAFIDVVQDFEQRLQPYIKPGSIIVGYGGDGTLSSIASLLSGTGAILAPLPGGTLNHFTKDIGISQDLSEAINNLPLAETLIIDTATVNGRTFLNNSSIGLYPTSLAERSRVESILGKWPAAVYASIRALIRFRLYTVTVQDNTYTTPFVFIGNNKYDIDRLMERNSLQRGKLSVFMIHSNKRLTLCKIVLLTLLRRVRQADEFTSFEADELTIQIHQRRVRVSYDGEHTKMTSPITYKLKKRSLKILK